MQRCSRRKTQETRSAIKWGFFFFFKLLTCFHRPRRRNRCSHRGPRWQGTGRRARRTCPSRTPWCCRGSLRPTVRMSPRRPRLLQREAAAAADGDGDARRNLLLPRPPGCGSPPRRCRWCSSPRPRPPPGLLGDGGVAWKACHMGTDPFIATLVVILRETWQHNEENSRDLYLSYTLWEFGVFFDPMLHPRIYCDVALEGVY